MLLCQLTRICLPRESRERSCIEKMDWSYRTISRKTDRWAGWAAVALGFSIPISTALDEILLVLILALWLAGDRFRVKITAVRDNPIVLPALLLFGMYLVGLLYGEASGREAMGALSKATNLLFIPILLFFFRDERVRSSALSGFLAALALTILISYLLWMGVIPPSRLFHITPDDAYTPFKHRITHSFLMAFGAYLFALKSRLEPEAPAPHPFRSAQCRSPRQCSFYGLRQDRLCGGTRARPLFPYRRMALAGRCRGGGRAGAPERDHLPYALFGSPSAH